MKTQNTLRNGWHLASRTEGRLVEGGEHMTDVERFFVLDEEGEVIYMVPECLEPEGAGNWSSDEEWFTVLIAVGQLCLRKYERGLDIGHSSGREAERHNLHRAIGVDKLVQSMEAIANEVTTLTNAVGNVSTRL